MRQALPWAAAVLHGSVKGRQPGVQLTLRV